MQTLVCNLGLRSNFAIQTQATFVLKYLFICASVLINLDRRKINFALQEQQNKFGTKIGPSRFILMTLFLEMRPV